MPSPVRIGGEFRWVDRWYSSSAERGSGEARNIGSAEFSDSSERRGRLVRIPYVSSAVGAMIDEWWKSQVKTSKLDREPQTLALRRYILRVWPTATGDTWQSRLTSHDSRGQSQSRARPRRITVVRYRTRKYVSAVMTLDGGGDPDSEGGVLRIRVAERLWKPLDE